MVIVFPKLLVHSFWEPAPNEFWLVNKDIKTPATTAAERERGRVLGFPGVGPPGGGGVQDREAEPPGKGASRLPPRSNQDVTEIRK